jgi:hypothetical protein
MVHTWAEAAVPHQQQWKVDWMPGDGDSDPQMLQLGGYIRLQRLNLSADTLLTQAGMMDGAPVGEAAPAARTDTEAAIRADPALSAAEQEALIQVYRSFIRDRSTD